MTDVPRATSTSTSRAIPRLVTPADELAARRAQRRQAFQTDPHDQRHGTENGYRNLGCRCPACREANARAHHAYMNDPAYPERKLHHRQSIREARARSRAAHPSNHNPTPNEPQP